MGKLNVSNIAKDIRTTMAKHSPEILTGVGIAGMIATTVLAVKATPKALSLIEDAVVAKQRSEIEMSIDEESSGKLTVVEIVKATWKCYIPAAVTGTMSIACLVGASSVNARRNAALAAAYTLSDTALREYREKVVETIGEKKEQLVRDKVAEEKIKKEPVSRNEVYITNKGDTLCFDAISGRYFKSDIDKIKKAANEVNRKMLNEMYISLNEFYSEIGLGHITLGDELGWNIDDGLIDLYFTSLIADDGTPCLVMNYEVAPRYGYSKFM